MSDAQATYQLSRLVDRFQPISARTLRERAEAEGMKSKQINRAFNILIESGLIELDKDMKLVRGKL